jgi:hypothetical protein
MSNKVWAGNMLNDVIVSEASFIARAAVWIAYYPLMHALSDVLDRYERMIHKRYEPVEFREPPEGWTRATVVE